MRDFVEAAKYAGRQTFPTLRLIAGQLDRGGSKYRLTNVDGRRCRNWDSIQDPKAKDGYYTRKEVLDWIATANEFDRTLGPVAASRKSPGLGSFQRLYEEFDFSKYHGSKEPEWPEQPRG